jgi:chloramphenicol 3-O-phosphotransferase
MIKPFVLVVTGLPCTGKSSIAQSLAKHFALPFISKDGFKELLFDELGWSDRDWSRKLGRASFRLLFYALEAQLDVGRSSIIEGNFHPDFHNQTLHDLKQRHGCDIFQIYCHCEPNIVLERFRARWERGERHPGHADNITMPEMETLVQEKSLALDIEGTTWNVDTSDFAKLEIEALITALSEKIL